MTEVSGTAILQELNRAGCKTRGLLAEPWVSGGTASAVDGRQ